MTMYEPCNRVKVTAFSLRPDDPPLTVVRSCVADIGDRLRGKDADRIDLSIRLNSRADFAELIEHLPVIAECMSSIPTEGVPTVEENKKTTPFDAALAEIMEGANRIKRETRELGMGYSSGDMLGYLRLSYDIWLASREKPKSPPMTLGKMVGTGLPQDVQALTKTVKDVTPDWSFVPQAQPIKDGSDVKMTSHPPYDGPEQKKDDPAELLIRLAGMLTPDEMDEFAKQFRRMSPKATRAVADDHPVRSTRGLRSSL